MSASQQKPSEKLNVIDRKTFDQIQQGKNNHAGVHRIRNSKYKKSHAKTGTAYDLMQYVKQPVVKQTASERRRYKIQRRIRNAPLRKFKKHGKSREGGKKRKHSRLKKSILRYRQDKQRLQAQQTQLNEAAEQLQALSITHETEGPLTPLSTPLSTSTAAPALKRPVKKVHSTRFRDYCDNCTTPKLGELTEQLLRDLYRFQKRAYSQNEVKARAHRRFVVGFREMQNYLRINKVKLVIIAPDCEQCTGEAGIDETIAAIKKQCQDENIPYVFSLRRRQLAYALYKKMLISCVAILDYDGARDLYADLIANLQEARQSYIDLIQQQDEEQIVTKMSTSSIPANTAITTALSSMQIDGNEVQRARSNNVFI